MESDEGDKVEDVEITQSKKKKGKQFTQKEEDDLKSKILNMGISDHPENEVPKKKKGKGKKKQKEENEEPEKTQEAGDDEEEEKEDSSVKKDPRMPIEVLYCGVCTGPVEYCSYGHKPEPCKKWLQDLHPELITEEEKKAEEDKKDENKEEDKTEGKKKKTKVKFEEAKTVKIVKSNRGKKKYITSVVGLQGFGVDLKESSKKMGKKFATGASVVKDEATGEESITIQGDVEYDLFEFLSKEYKIDKKAIKVVDATKKKAPALL